MVKLLYGLGITLLLFSCGIQRKCSDCCVVLSTLRTYDKQGERFTLPPYVKDRKMWYKDSMVIAENISTYINVDSVGNETWRTLAETYTFIDLRKQSFYIFSTFSDTASLIKKYPQPDTGRVEGGWNFFNEKGSFIFDNRIVLPDTIINGIEYKRFMANGDIPVDDKTTVHNVQVAYLRCDKKKSPFYIDLPLSKKTGCPVVRFDTIAENGIWIKVEFEFLPDKLTKEEIKVFNAWKRYAQSHPVRE